MPKKPPKVYTGVSLDADVAEYLEQLGKRDDRDRSWLINAIVREHAGRHGKRLDAKAPAQSTRRRRKQS